jgi:hypothetical protein
MSALLTPDRFSGTKDQVRSAPHGTSVGQDLPMAEGVGRNRSQEIGARGEHLAAAFLSEVAVINQLSADFGIASLDIWSRTGGSVAKHSSLRSSPLPLVGKPRDRFASQFELCSSGALVRVPST